MGPVACVVAGQIHSSLLLSRGGGASRTAGLNLSCRDRGRCPGPSEEESRTSSWWGPHRPRTKPSGSRTLRGSGDWGSILALPAASCVILAQSLSLPEPPCPHPQDGVIVAGSLAPCLGAAHSVAGI